MAMAKTFRAVTNADNGDIPKMLFNHECHRVWGWKSQHSTRNYWNNGSRDAYVIGGYGMDIPLRS